MEAVNTSRGPSRKSPENIILSSLKFPFMNDRLDRTEHAHPGTFDWIFEEKATDQWHNFPIWLGEGTGIYWINGKPGAGKSILMRKIVEDPQTQSRLQQWSDEDEAVIVAVFLRKTLLPDQASQSGLLRSLLYRILKQMPQFIKETFPNEWQKMNEKSASPISHPETRWDLAKLRAGFERLFQQDLEKLCIFIDGLDEYEGEPQSLIRLLKEITMRNSKVKFCLSSRPGAGFTSELMDAPQLQLQDFTKEDFKVYANNVLSEDPRTIELWYAEPVEAQKLVENIATNPNGVFLWVKLVVQHLLKDLNSKAGFSPLHKHLQSIPKDIESFYHYLFEEIEINIADESYRLFEIMRTYEEMLRRTVQGFTPLPGYFINQSQQRPTVDPLLLCIAKDRPLESSCYSVELIHSSEAIRNRMLELRSALEKSCAGLLEVVPVEESLLNDTSQSQNGGVYMVVYVHRTVAEYWEKRRTIEMPSVSKISSTNFNASLSLFAAQSFLLQNYNRLPFSYSISLEQKAILAMLFAHRADQETDHNGFEFLEDLGDFLTRQFSRVREINQPTDFYWGHRFLQLITTGTTLNWPDKLSEIETGVPYILSLAVMFGLTSYVKSKLNQLKSRHREKILTYLLSQASTSRALIDTKMITLLIDQGARLNWNDWKYVLVSFGCTDWRYQSGSNNNMSLREQMKLFRLLLDTGVDPYITFVSNPLSRISMSLNKEHQQNFTISSDDIFNHCFGKHSDYSEQQYQKDYEELLATLKSKRTSMAWIKHRVDIRHQDDRPE